MLKLYGRANSINVRKVLWIADELGITLERSDWGRGYRSTAEPEFQKVSHFSMVPVIDDDGFVLRESNAIVRYLCAKHGRTDLYPSELRPRALVEAWMDWAGADLYRGLRPVFLGLTVKQPAFQDAGVLAMAKADWIAQMGHLEAELAAHGPYLAGNSFTIADIPAGLMVHRWYSIEFGQPKLPAVAAYYELLSARPAYLRHGRNGTP